MRIQPVFNKLNNRNNKVTQTQFRNSGNSFTERKAIHKYTGVASVDLAYASMFDSAIAKDLKMMNLI